MDEIKEAREAFDHIAEYESQARQQFDTNIAFAMMEEQWPEAVRRQRELDGRPCLTVNRLAVLGRQVVNDARQNKPGIIVSPSDDNADPETAEIFSGLIRNIEASSNAEVAYDTALEQAVFGGFGYFRINTAYTSDDTFEQDIVIERISNALSVYGDCDSTAADSSDWNVAFVTDNISKTEFEKRFKGADPVDWEDDAWRDVGSPWRDGDQVMIAEWWKREEVKRSIVLLSDGQVMDAADYAAQKDLFDAIGLEVTAERDVKSHKVIQRLMSGAEELSKVEWAGKYIPIIPVYGTEVNYRGKRYWRSLTQGAMDAQRMFNYWRTAATELVALAPKAPFIGPKGAFVTDAPKWASANTQSHAFIEYDGGTPPQRQAFAGVPAGAVQEALNAADDIKATVGIFDAGVGARSNETSGVAIRQRQLESDVSTFHFIDNLSRAIRHAGRVLIDLIPQVYSVPRVVRILGIDGTPDMARVNEPVTEQVRDPETGQVQEISKIYDLGAGKYDCVVKAGPSFSTQREEAATQMIELIRAYPDAAPLIGDLLAKSLDWPGADEIAERMEMMLPPQLRGEGAEGAPAGPPQEEVAAMMQQMQTQLQALATENEQLKAQYELKAQEIQVKRFDAETKRIQAMKPPPLPKEVGGFA